MRPRSDLPSCGAGTHALGAMLFLACVPLALAAWALGLLRRPEGARVRPPTVRACDPDEPESPRDLCHAYSREASVHNLDWLASGEGPDPLDGETPACVYGGPEGRCPHCVGHVESRRHRRVAGVRS